MYADMQAQQAAAAPEAAQAGASTGAGAGAKPAEDDVVDADFKEVKDK
jgi:molecular chaperone DnaK